MTTFPALLLHEDQGKVRPELTRLGTDQLPAGDVLVQVEWTTLNYKDGMILSGLGRLVRTYPHVPGIDFAGTVVTSESPLYQPGDKVILTGWRVGEVHWGGYAGMARVRSEWLVPLPSTLTTRQAMIIGTAGLTAMLAVMALQDHGITAESGPVLVTGAAGGLGSVATLLLSRLGYAVEASSGRPEQRDYLTALGASRIIDRAELSAGAAKPLLAERWAGCVDSVGGATLSHVLASLKLHGAVACCGNAGGVEMHSTVLPLLLRGISILGIDSAQCPKARRVVAWDQLARLLPLPQLEDMSTEIGLSDLPHMGKAILRGDVRGRTVVKL